MSVFNALHTWARTPPANWRTDWLKWGVSLSTERPTEAEIETLPYIANEDITSWTGKLLNPVPKPVEADSRKFQRDDVLFSKLRPYLAKVYHAEFDGLSSGELLCLRPSSSVLARYLFYVVSSKAFVDAVNAETFGSKMPRADWEIVGHQPLPLPTLDTQKRIAAFLDEKTARIEGLIVKKQALLERLAEKRQAIITQAVTKGLNPNAPMKDSGIDWLGEIPAHWSVEPLGRSVDWIEQGWSPQCEERLKIDHEWGVLRSGCVNNGVFRADDHKTLPADLDPRDSLEVKVGDFLFCRASGSIELIGSAAHVKACPPRLMFSDKTYRVRPNPERIRPEFLHYLFMAKYMRDQIVLSVSGADGLANNIPQSKLKKYIIARPILAEQNAIYKKIKTEIDVIEDIETGISHSVKMMSEYRSALITAAVTGQMEI
jgi:type I restriction enzyme S subunit